MLLIHTAVDACKAYSCHNGGTCRNLGNGRISCSCRSGYKGTYCQTGKIYACRSRLNCILSSFFPHFSSILPSFFVHSYYGQLSEKSDSLLHFAIFTFRKKSTLWTIGNNFSVMSCESCLHCKKAIWCNDSNNCNHTHKKLNVKKALHGFPILIGLVA